MYTGHWYGGRSYLAEWGEYELLPGWTFHRDLTTSALESRRHTLFGGPPPKGWVPGG